MELIADAGAALDALAVARVDRIAAECRELVLVGNFADTVSVSDAAVDSPERWTEKFPGGDGTPGVEEFAPAELGAVLGISSTAAWGLLGDVLDLRHRLPRLWARVVAGEVEGWKARRVAYRTHHLSPAAAGAVDEKTDGLMERLAWGRFQNRLDAEVLAADPQVALERARAFARQRFVRTMPDTVLGAGSALRMLSARADATDVVWFDAMVARVAECLRVDGSTASLDVRRSEALGILAQPAVALALLTRHATDAPTADAPATDLDVSDLGYLPPDARLEPVLEPPSGPDPLGDPESLSGGVAAPDPHVSVGLGLPAGISSDQLDRLVKLTTPQAVIHVHVAGESLESDTGAAVVRVEGVGPVTTDDVRRWLRHPTLKVTVRPVLDPAGIAPVDSYEIPDRMADTVRYRNPYEVFPFGGAPSRTLSSAGTGTGVTRLDLDHTVRYLPPARGGPPGQTRPDNLAPLGRHHHRAKTAGAFTVRQPDAGVFLWRSRHGFFFAVDDTGTHPLGRTPWARALWHALLNADTHLEALGDAA